MTDTNSLASLLDFSDLKKQKSHTFGNYTESNTQDSSDNQNLLRSFKQLRQKLKFCQKENNQLKEQSKINTIRLKQNQQALQQALVDNLQLRDQVDKEVQNNVELKRRFKQMKEQLSMYNKIQQQLSFTKQALLEARLKQKSQSNEQKKTLEIFLQEKLEMEQEVSKLRAKANSDQKFMKHLEQQAARSKEQNIRLENHMRKLSISFEEASFNQKFEKQNFELYHLKNTIEQLETEVNTLRSKLSKQKERRYLLEEQLIHLEESAGINNVKAVTYEGQTEMLAKKHEKLTKNVEQLTEKLQKLSVEKINIEQQAIKYQMLSEQVIAKLKPLLTEDMIEILAYYENKLKTVAYVDKEAELQEQTQRKPLYVDNTYKKSQQRQPLQEQNYFNIYNPSPYKQHQFNPHIYRSAGKPQALPNTNKFSLSQDKQNQLQQHVLENKIRRQRDQMEKKLKDKWFQKKFDCSMPSQMYKLRADYINTFIDR